MPRADPPIGDLLSLEENEANERRHDGGPVPADDGDELYEPLWERQSVGRQNGATQQPEMPPPLPRRNTPTNRSAHRTAVVPVPPSPNLIVGPSRVALPSYTESQSSTNSPAGRGPTSPTTPNSLQRPRIGRVLPPALNIPAPSSFTTNSPLPTQTTTNSTSPLECEYHDAASAFRGVGGSPYPLDEAGALPSKMMEAMGLSGGEQVFGWNAPPMDEQGAPPPYMPRSASVRGPQVSLKEGQVDTLKREMEHAGGVKVILRKLDCYHTVVWVECFGGVWISGWNQKARPFLHNAFHVGDQIISINGQVIEGARMAHKLIKHSDDTAKITFILRRVPNARIFLLKRTEDGESLGIRRDGGTGEILDLEPFGVAAHHGMPVRAPTHDRHGLCNWYITEVNMRPVSLYFKRDEIEKRLNAVGKEISILIQPGDFINEIKNLMKRNFKNYKDYIVQ